MEPMQWNSCEWRRGKKKIQPPSKKTRNPGWETLNSYFSKDLGRMDTHSASSCGYIENDELSTDRNSINLSYWFIDKEGYPCSELRHWTKLSPFGKSVPKIASAQIKMAIFKYFFIDSFIKPYCFYPFEAHLSNRFY